MAAAPSLDATTAIASAAAITTLSLPFQRDIFAEILAENGLLVVGRGLGLECILDALVHVYASPKLLVFLLGCSVDEETRLLHGFTAGIDELRDQLPFTIVKNDTPAEKRVAIYAAGGVIAITARIMLIDLLKGRIPAFTATGLLFYRAHRVAEHGIEAFIASLFRRANADGFIKAFSDAPEALMGGFAHIEKTLKWLHLPKLLLYPRFHVEIDASLAVANVQVIELRQSLSSKMKIMQLALIEAMQACLNEMAKANPSLDIQELALENSLFKTFHLSIRNQLDSTWHQVSYKTKQLIEEVDYLRSLFGFMLRYDAVQFNRLLEALLLLGNSGSSGSSSWTGDRPYWMLLDAANTLFATAKQRADNFESNPKWKLLQDTITELRSSGSSIHNHLHHPSSTILIMVEDEQTQHQLQILLGSSNGAKTLLDSSQRSYLAWKKTLRQVRVSLANTSSPSSASATTSRTKRPKVAKSRPSPTPDVSPSDSTTSPLPEDEALLEPICSLPPDILIKPYHEISRPEDLSRLHPTCIIMYDIDVAFIRTVELFKSIDYETTLQVYFMIYTDSVEEQKYLATIRKEKEAFEKLIRAKASMSLPLEDTTSAKPTPAETDRDDNDDGDLLTGNEVAISRISEESELVDSGPTTIVVDIRELRSSLPFVLHQAGFRLEPRTIAVGDYVLSRDICVERKTVADLIGSLNSGRLYAQTESMCRKYAIPILLVEFDKDRPFFLLPSTLIRDDISPSDVSSKLVLLLIHFPKLKILWSKSPFQSAIIFRDLKRGQEEPDLGGHDDVHNDDGDSRTETDEPMYSQSPRDLLLKLPGVNENNCNVVMRTIPTLRHLFLLDYEQLATMIGNENGRRLHNFIHNVQ